MQDLFDNNMTGMESPARHAFVITPSDSDDDHCLFATRGIYVGVAGDVKLEFVWDENPVVLKNLAAGVIHPICAKHIYATGTTATDIIGVY